MKPSALGELLKHLRSQKGLSRVKAAKSARLSATRLYEFEVGRSSSTGRPTAPSREQIKRLAVVYGVPADELLERAGYVTRSHVAPDVERLVDLYRRLPMSARQALLGFLETIT